MARYVREVVLNRPGDFVQYIMSDFLYKHGFHMVEFKGQQVLRAGGGLIEIPKFLVWSYQNGVFHVEAWTRNVWLPGVYGREIAMTGFLGCVPKSAYKKDIEELIGLLTQPLYTNGAPGQPGYGAPGQPGYGVPGQPGRPGYGAPQPIYVRGTDMSRYATMALIFSILGAGIGIVAGIFGILFGILGVLNAKKSMYSEKRGFAIAAMIIGIIAIVIGVIGFVGGIILRMYYW